MIALPRATTFQPMSGMDAGFLYMETPTLHMHTLKVALLKPSGLPDGIPFSLFRRILERKLAKLSSFKQRLMDVPFGLDHPVWVTDEDFDLSRHLAHRRAPAPGGRKELNEIVSEIASTPLPRDRPLWEITMVNGLEGGRVAFVCKLHHSMADGAAALEMLLEVFAQPENRVEPTSPGAQKALVTTRAGRDELVPAQRELAIWAGVRVLLRIGSLPRLAWQTLRGLAALALRALDGSHPHPAAPFSGPRTSWSGALSARRSFATTALPLKDVKRAKRALGVSLNDVVLGVCGGALRAHLAEVEGGVPSQSLVASVPTNTHPNMVGRTRGNHVGHLTASLCTHIADPVERVRAIHEMTDEAKQRQIAVGADLLERWFEFTPPKPYTSAIRFWSEHRMADIFPAPINLVVSNVPGPREPLEIAGARLEALFSVGPILEGAGLNLTGWSYGDQMNFVGLGCPDQIADLQGLVDRLPEALAELVRACEPRPAQALPEPTKPTGALRAVQSSDADRIGNGHSA